MKQSKTNLRYFPFWILLKAQIVEAMTYLNVVCYNAHLPFAFGVMMWGLNRWGWLHRYHLIIIGWAFVISHLDESFGVILSWQFPSKSPCPKETFHPSIRKVQWNILLEYQCFFNAIEKFSIIGKVFKFKNKYKLKG